MPCNSAPTASNAKLAESNAETTSWLKLSATMDLLMPATIQAIGKGMRPNTIAQLRRMR